MAGAVAVLAAVQARLFYPGIVDADSGYQYREFHGGVVGDWHPPAMTRLWQGLEAIGLTGSGPLLILHLALFWSGIALLAAALALRGRAWPAVAIIGCSLIPTVFGWMTVVIKDSSLTASLIAATGIVAWYGLAGRKVTVTARCGVAALLAYALLVRGNAVFAVLPLAGVLAGAAERRGWRGPATVALAAVAAMLATPAINHAVLRAEPDHAEHSLMVFDIAGIAHFAALPTLAGVSGARWADATRRGCYTPYTWDAFASGGACGWAYDKLDGGPIAGDWIAAIFAHPLAYARHRVAHWNATLRFVVPSGLDNAVSDAGSTPNPFGIGAPGSRAHWELKRIETLAAATPLGWPCVYFALALSVGFFAWRSPLGPLRTVTLALAASSATQFASFAVVSVASDMRYHHWAILAAALSAVLLVAMPGVSRRGYARVWAAPGAVALVALVARIVIGPAV